MCLQELLDLMIGNGCLYDEGEDAIVNING